MRIGKVSRPTIVPKRIHRKVVIKKEEEKPIYIPIKSPAKKEENVPA